MASTRPALTPRALAPADVAAVVDIVNADRLPGQPRCTEAMLADTVAGRSPVDSGWWAELDQPAVEVVCDGAGVIRGAVSYARRRRDDTGLVLWLHGREEPSVVTTLLDQALGRLAGVATVEAFQFASALTVGLEGLPARHRRTTREALLTRGFIEADLWRYLRRDLPADLPLADGARIVPEDGQSGWRVELSDDGVPSGQAEVSIPVPELGVVWWIDVAPRHRRRGLGRTLLGSALDTLHRHGAREVILFVDDDAPPDDPDRGRGAANTLYDRAGFIEVDRLCSYRRSG